MRAGPVVLVAFIAVPVFAHQPSSTPERMATSRPADDAALALLQRDAVLNYWALKYYDADGDVTLSPAEAAVAAQRLKVIADADCDGRVTTYEFDRAREFIAARF